MKKIYNFCIVFFVLILGTQHILGQCYVVNESTTKELTLSSGIVATYPWDAGAVNNGSVYFDAKTSLATTTNAKNMTLQQTTDGKNWTDVQTYQLSTSYKSYNTTKLASNAIGIRFSVGGIYTRSVKNVKVGMATFQGTPSVSFVDFGQVFVNESSTQSFTIDWCNVDAFTTTLPDNSPYVIDIANNASTCTYGKATINVTCNPTARGTYNQTLTINGANGYNKTISLSATAVIRKQNANLQISDIPATAWNTTITPTIRTLNTESEVILTQLDSEHSAKLVDGQIVVYNVEGTVHFRATQEETDFFNAAQFDFAVVVKPANNHVTFTLSNDNYTAFENYKSSNASWNANSYTLGDGGWSAQEDYVILNFTGVPDTLTFDKSLNKSVGQLPGTYLCQVYESTTGADNTWSKVWEHNKREESTPNQVVRLKAGTQYVKLLYNGTVSANYSNIRITERSEVNIDNLDFGSDYKVGDAATDGNITFQWYNVPALTITSSNPDVFEVTTPTIAAGIDAYDEAAVIGIRYHHNEVSPEEGDRAIITIVSANGAINRTIEVTGHTFLERNLEWEQDFMQMLATEDGLIDEFIPLTARVLNGLGLSTGDAITYTVDDTSIAEVIANQDGSNTLHIFGVGKTTLHAHVPATLIYGALYDTREIRVRRDGDACETVLLFVSKESSFRESSSTQAAYAWDGPCSTLSFEVKKLSVLTISDNPRVEGYNTATGKWDWTYKFSLSTSWQKHEVSLPSTISQLRWVCDDFEAGSKSVRNVTVMQASYLNASVAVIDHTDTPIKVGDTFSETFQINYSDIPLIHYEVSHVNTGNLVLTPLTTINNDCGNYGSYQFTISGVWNEPQDVNENIIFTTSAGDNLTIPVRLTVELAADFISKEDGEWNEATNWQRGSETSDVAPSADNSVIINNIITVTGQVEAYSITLTEQGQLIVAANGGITVGAGGIIGANAGNLRLRSTTESQAYLRIAPEFDGLMPVATVEYATRATLDNGGGLDAAWQYFGVPGVATMDVQADTWLLPYDETSVTDGWGDYITGQAALAPFQCYTITQYGQPTYEFEAQLLHDNHDITLTRTEGAVYEGDNMFANSYMSPLDIKNFTAEDFDEGVERVFYLYNTGSWNEWNTLNEQGTSETREATSTPGQYYAIPALSAAVLDPAYDQSLIAPLQGVEIKTTIHGAQLHLNYAKHVWSARETSGNSLIKARRSHGAADILTRRVRIALTSEQSGSDRIYLLESPDYTVDYDNGYDAPKIITEGLANLYINENFGEMSISATDQIIGHHIGLQAGADNLYTLHITSIIGDEIALLDTETEQVYMLSEGQTISLQAQPYSRNDYRLRIIERPNPEDPTITTAMSNTTAPAISNDGCRIRISGANGRTLSMHNIAGMLVAQYALTDGNIDIDITSLAHGVYCLTLGDTTYKFVR